MTSGPTIFPAADDDGCEPFREIAKHIGCTEDEVHNAFRGIDAPEWVTPEHRKTVKARTESLNRAARLAKSLEASLLELSREDLDDLISAGCITTQQLWHLRWALENDAKDLKTWLKERDTGSRKNLAAHGIAEAIRRLFRRKRKNITFGQSSCCGGPSTEFGRAVEVALAAFGVTAQWRSPTRVAYEKQLAIQNRRLACATAKARRDA